MLSALRPQPLPLTILYLNRKCNDKGLYHLKLQKKKKKKKFDFVPIHTLAMESLTRIEFFPEEHVYSEKQWLI
jgi:hypothetical protein